MGEGTRKTRSEQRIRKRLPVRMLWADGETIRFTGNVSSRGMLVLGRIPTRQGPIFDLAVDLPELGMARLRARVAWGKDSPLGLERIIRAGFGAEVIEAPPAWYAWCRDLEARRGSPTRIVPN